MLLTKKMLRIILENLRVKIPAELEKELLDEYGNSLPMTQGMLLNTPNRIFTNS